MRQQQQQQLMMMMTMVVLIATVVMVVVVMVVVHSPSLPAMLTLTSVTAMLLPPLPSLKPLRRPPVWRVRMARPWCWARRWVAPL